MSKVPIQNYDKVILIEILAEIISGDERLVKKFILKNNFKYIYCFYNKIFNLMKLATLCYIKDKINNKILMIYRNKKENDMHKGKWNGLGGKLELGETPEECVIREVEEESGLTIESPILKGFITFPAFDGFEDWYVFVFVAENFYGDLINSNEGELEWINIDNLFDLNLWEGDEIFLKWLKDDKFFSAKFIYENGKLLDYKVMFY